MQRLEQKIHMIRSALKALQKTRSRKSSFLPPAVTTQGQLLVERTTRHIRASWGAVAEWLIPAWGWSISIFQ